MSSSTPAHQPSRSARGVGGELRVSSTALWILHRDEAVRRGLAEHLGIRGAQLADPREASQEGPAAPRAILLGVADDFEAELEFAFQFSQREPRVQWLVFATSDDLAEATRLFDTLPAEVVDQGDDPEALRQRTRAMLARREAPPLSERQRRSQLTERFTRWFADLQAPALFAATDPKRVRIPILILGESGTGRGVLARYLHQLATGVPAGPFLSIPCAGLANATALRAAVALETGRLPSGQLATLCLEDVDRLPPALQGEIARWIDYGPPGELPVGARVRWIATASTPPEPTLAEAMAGLEIALPALREQRDRIGQLAAASARAWCLRHDFREREFSEAAIARLRDYAWPGNLRELDAVVARSLARSSESPLPAEALALPEDGQAEAPPPEPVVEEQAPATPKETLAAEPVDLRSELVEELEPFEVATPDFGPEEPEAPEALLDVPEMEGAFEATGASRTGLRRLAGALAHEIGNPLVGIRSFAQMLPRRFEDPEFRRVATDRVVADTARIEHALDTLSRLASPASAERDAVDLSALSAGLLAERRGQIQERGLVVLEELDRERAWVSGNRDQIRGALVSLFDAVFDLLPERGDLYVATQGPPEGDPTGFARALVRFSTADGPGDDGLSRAEQSLGLAASELLIEEQGGHLVLDLSEAPTALVLFELPAAAPERPASEPI